jgi:hypothetical protein
LKHRRYGGTRPGTLLKHQIPIKTDNWVAQCEESIPERVAALKKLQSQLDPFELLQTIDRKLQRLYRLAHQHLSPRVARRKDLG